MLDDAALRPHPARRSAVSKAWSELSGPGSVLTAAQRRKLIRWARAAWAGSRAPDPEGGLMAEAAHWLAVDAGGITAEVVDDFEARGLDRWHYLEAVGVIGRLSNIDFYARGLGASLPPLPPLPDPAEGDDGAPSGVRADDIALRGFVPSAGPLFAPMVLDALPNEGAQLRALHEPMYLPMAEIGNSTYHDELSRLQIEYVAARSSYLNECFY